MDFSFPDYTKYHFVELNGSWFTCCFDSEGKEYRYPFNKGKFGYTDYNDNCLGHFTGYWDWCKISRNERKGMRSTYIQNNTPLSFQDYRNMKSKLQALSIPCVGEAPCATTNTISFTTCTPYSLDCCKPAPIPQPAQHYVSGYWTDNEQQGNNPMRIETNSATAVVSAVRSDEAIQRDYLMAEFSRLTAYDQKFGELREFFNIDAPKYPKDTQTLIDAFKDGKIVIDQAKVDANTKLLSGEGGRSYDDADDYVGGRFYGLTFTALPTPDYKGWEAAKEAYEALKTATKRKIIVGSPADGLAALEALEAWTPTQNAPTTATVQ